MDIIAKLRQRAKEAHRHIVLPEGYDERIMRAAEVITKEEIAHITLLGKEEKLRDQAAKLGVDLTGIDMLDPETHDLYEEFAEQYYELRNQFRRDKRVSKERAYEVLKSPILCGVMMVRNDMVDGMVAGAITSTADVLRPAFRIIRTRPDIKLASAAFIMVTPKPQYGENGVIMLADGAVNPVLEAEDMADVAFCSANTAKDLLGFEEPRVAMMSFSTKGSAKHESVDKVAEATRIANEKYPDLLVDGEMQLDAAICPEVAAIKAPFSPVAGRANILIYPDLTCANNAYKLIQRFGDAKVIGPVLQGMAKPVNDLSRGCSVEEIVNTVAVDCCMQPYPAIV
ncbi:MAG: phosphate acetyltransferase [Firmicutes bacterium]|nr:phosphate acetyltransferase [Bacillota bacterium]